ncbi:aminoglycoside phosphotransferase family protein [Streptomyces sp. GESEQ-35]|uniref:aminoglycoside phosphotransferase family protein n=1 Tax=Streptomyces sp. GESEQ-35 TaxID=2812657 RepID=UPI001B33017F|nr:aminoglycoside phosphotransferase family protein [Streptomyces sp. GESEQ-35]
MRSDDAALESVGRTRRRAREIAGDQPLHGPLAGYHHEAYAFPHHGVPGARRMKLREPRPNVIWFDRRAFDEVELLTALADRVRGIPDVIRVGSATLHQFIEGQTLGSRFAAGTEIPNAVVAQLMGLVRDLAAIRPDSLPVEWRVPAEDREADGDSRGFLARLVHFAEEQVYARNEHRFGTLFRDLGVDANAFKRLRRHLDGVAERPFHLLHGDLRRENLILDPSGRLWTIDWELAVFGDPLYDLATHLYLTRYPEGQRRRMAELWTATVEDAAAGASRHWQEDLPRILGFKRAQSVFTDVIRAALDLADGAPLRATVPLLCEVLRDGAVPLGLSAVPTPCETAVALTRWRRGYAS